jgi:hypothetical protein
MLSRLSRSLGASPEERHKVTKLKPGCEKQRWDVCEDHIVVTCPKCGHQAFWIHTKQHPHGRYCCFRADPWCDWVSICPPERS